MNWIKENKFLAGYLIAVVIGIIVFGGFLFASWSHYSQSSDTYNRQVGELHRLQNLGPYPDQENLLALKRQKDDYIQQAQALREKLVGMEKPTKKTSPEQFQAQLHEAVLDIRQKADQGGVKLDDKFYLGFDRYRNELPAEANTTTLTRELNAVHFMVSDMMQNKVVELKSIQRLTADEGVDSKASKGRSRARKAEPIQSRAVLLEFTTDQAALRKIIDDISASTQHFYVIRGIKVLNEKQEPPSRSDTLSNSSSGSSQPVSTTAEVSSAATQQTAGAAKKPQAEELHPVLGTEKLNVTMQVDILNFTRTDKNGLD